jgi:peptidoglycan/LPS O-acetylase OafA/YrhL
VSGVDGVRAFAAVPVDHLGCAWLPGGVIGVIFLVISGYLITSLLPAERRAT